MVDRGDRDRRPRQGRGQDPDGSGGHVPLRPPPGHRRHPDGAASRCSAATRARASSPRSAPASRTSPPATTWCCRSSRPAGSVRRVRPGMRNLCDLGAGLLGGAAVSDGTFRIQAKGQNVFPMTLLGTFSPVHGRAQELGGEDRPVDPVRGGLPGRLRRHHRLRLGGPHRRHPARARTSRSSASAASACRRCRVRSTPARATSSPSTRSSGSATQALKFGATHVYPDIDAAMAGIAEVTARPDGPARSSSPSASSRARTSTTT